MRPLSLELAEPLAATAPTAAHLAAARAGRSLGCQGTDGEPPGPWLGRALDGACAGTGVRVALIRRPGRHADRRSAGDARWSSPTPPLVRPGSDGKPWPTRGACWSWTSPLSERAITPGFGTDHSGRAAGAGVHQRTAGPLLRAARPPARRANWPPPATARSGRSPTSGGHRFSPTMLVLPYGYSTAGLTRTSAKNVPDSHRRGPGDAPRVPRTLRLGPRRGRRPSWPSAV